jgi:hypothetical protein
MKKRWVLIAVGVIAAGLLLLPLVVPLLIPWTEINCRHDDINIKTGKVRYSRYVWFVKVSEEIRDTPLSLALKGEMVDVADIPAWQRVNTLSPGTGHSPHYFFHAALYQANRFELISSLQNFSPDRKREAAKAILTSWQKSGDYWGADRYLENLEEVKPGG